MAVLNMFYNALSDEGFLLCEYSQEIPEDINYRFLKVLPEKKLYQKTLLK
jgi:chemotaxis methyl-accepting protein methylase